MGLSDYMVDALVREHTYRPITGDVLLIGRQTVYLSPPEAVELIRSHGVSPAIDVKDIASDQDTRNRRTGRPERELISDFSLFSLLGNETVKALDHSDYEGAQVVHNLSAEVPDRLKGCADFIVDGSTLDNTFNPALTLKNYAELLRPGGRLLAINQFSNHFDPYVMVNPCWFLDYFVMNAFADCKVYVVVDIGGKRNVFCIDPQGLLDPRRRGVRTFVAARELATVVVAEKGPASSTAASPTQDQYRSDEDWTVYRKNLAEMTRCPRPHVVRSNRDLALFDVPGGYLFIDRRFDARDPKTEERHLRATPDRPARPTLLQHLKYFILRLLRLAGYEVVRRVPEK